MPPRTRKTAAPAPSLEDAAAATEPTETGTPAETEPEAAEPAVSPSPDAETVGDDDEAPAPESLDGDNEPEQPAPVEAQTFHWESVKGDGTEPCRLCTLGGPPPGVGSFGCGHGQWVRVQDVA